jgi:hypothetical protein
MKNNILSAIALTSIAFGNAWADGTSDANSRFHEGNGEGAYVASQLKQNAYFEATQVVGRFFLCIPEAANQKDKRDTLANIDKCFEETTDAAIVNDIGGALSYGRGATLNIATRVLAPLRKDVTFSLTTPFISKYTRGVVPGTGTIELTFNSLVHQNITALAAGLPFDASKLGGQLFVAQDRMSLKADVPGEWKITVLKVIPLLTQISPNIQFTSPFPSYPIFPAVDQ